MSDDTNTAVMLPDRASRLVGLVVSNHNRIVDSAEASQHTADLERQLTGMKRELSDMEACVSSLHAEADTRGQQLAEQTARAEAAEKECADLQEGLAACDAEIAAHEAKHAEQVLTLPCRSTH